jgi:hypothetical protein
MNPGSRCARSRRIQRTISDRIILAWTWNIRSRVLRLDQPPYRTRIPLSRELAGACAAISRWQASPEVAIIHVASTCMILFKVSAAISSGSTRTATDPPDTTSYTSSRSSRADTNGCALANTSRANCG